MPRSSRLRKTTVLVMVAHTPKRSAPRYRTARGSMSKLANAESPREAIPEETRHSDASTTRMSPGVRREHQASTIALTA